MLTRRQFIRTSAGTASALVLPIGLVPERSTRRNIRDSIDGPGPPTFPSLSHLAPGPGSVYDLARDESYWNVVQQAFPIDRSIIHLNNGGVCPAPTIVQESERAHLLEANRHPFYEYYGRIVPQLELIRQRLADCLGCLAEEIALTRNTSEGMEICQLGLDLESGDEILTTEHDYPRMLATWEQRAERDGILLRKVPVSVPLREPGALVDRMEDAITPRTRLVMCCHLVDITGQLMPVKSLADMAHRHGIPILVDGAQSFGHIDFQLADLECDFFATSLHKWLMGPQGTGLLYVRRDRIRDIWPLMPCESASENDIRKFEDVGTQSPAKYLALGDAMDFQRTIGPELKAARLRYLRDYWLLGLQSLDRITLLTHLPTAGALATIAVDGLDPVLLRDFLWNRHRIRVRPIRQVGVEGIRISASIYNPLPDLDRLVSVMTDIVRDGIPST